MNFSYIRPTRSVTCLSVSFAALLASVPSGAFAQDSSTDLGVVILYKDDAILADADTRISDADINVKNGGDVTDSIRSTPGAFTRSPSDNPAVSVNIRGMQGSGRVNTMIEGVPQTFRNLSGHAGSFDDQVFIDPNLMAGIDIARGAVSGADGVGALTGAADFRLMDVDDVLIEGNSQGGLLRYGFGNNGSTFDAVAAAAIRSGAFDGMIAISGYAEENFVDGDENEVATDVDSNNGMIRMGYEISDHASIELLGLWGETNFLANSSSGYYWETEKNMGKVSYQYNPGSNAIDLSVEAYLQNDNIYFPGDEEQSSSSFNGRDGTDTGQGLKVTNTSVIDLANNELALTYGATVQHNEYDGNSSSGANASGALTKVSA